MAREMGDVLRAFSALGGDASSAVLATLVRVRGSAYRRAGARMVLRDSAPQVGAISGGCLERDVAKRAWFLTEAGPAIVTYDSRTSDEDDESRAGDDLAHDDDLSWGFGLGCEGAVDVLLERLGDGAAAEALTFAAACRRARRRAVVVTVFRTSDAAQAPLGARLLVDASGDARALGISAASPFVELLRARARGALETGGSSVVVEAVGGDELEAFVEVIDPPLPLFVFGAGYDAAPLVNLASAIGWEVTVVASRAGEILRDRFAQAARIVVAATHDEAAVASLDIDQRSAVVVMSHNYPRDLSMLRKLVASPARYVGLLGPRRRTDRMLSELSSAGEAPTDSERARIHAPIGLDLGAEGAEEVALAVVAEILATTTGRSGGALRDRDGPIHTRDVRGPDGKKWRGV